MFKNFVYIRLVVKYSFCSYVPDATLDSLIPHSIFYVKQINSFFSKIAAGSSMGLLQRVSNSSGLFGLGVQLFELWGLSRMPRGAQSSADLASSACFVPLDLEESHRSPVCLVCNLTDYYS